MQENITILLEEIKQKRLNRRRVALMQAPASTEMLTVLQENGRKNLNYDFPDDYLSLLFFTDGIESNGIILYASHTQLLMNSSNSSDDVIEGIIEANIGWREQVYGEHNINYIYYAESGDYLYCYSLLHEKFQIIDRITLEPIYSPSEFDSVGELLEMMLNHMLDRYPTDSKF